jgi:MazG family protein
LFKQQKGFLKAIYHNLGPKMENQEFKKLQDVIKRLRDPKEGCPWDLKQTHQSLLPYLIEESFEFINAVENKDNPHMEEELGDILLQVLLHSTIAEQDNQFNLETISKKLADKLINRHPHIFKNKESDINSEQVEINWEKIKQEEKRKKGEKQVSFINESLLNLPSMLSSFKIGKKTETIGFDWDNYGQVIWKVEEEWQELKEELAPQQISINRVEEELGDFLFSTVQLARHLKLDPEKCLRAANKKFIKRFQKMEKLINQDGLNINHLNQKEMDIFWNEAKKEK